MRDMSEFRITNLENISFLSSDRKTVLDCAIDAGIIFEHSCKTGRCGKCKATLLEGEVSEILPQSGLITTSKDNQFLTCCCMATSDILIDAEDISTLHWIKSKIFPCRINSIDLLSENIIKVKLRLPPALNMLFLPGQFIDVIGPNSIKRSYSIASIPASKEISLLIKRIEYGEFSDYWFNEAKPNDFLRIEGPKGTFFLRDKQKKLVFLATGTGIAPIQSILEALDSDPNFNQSESISLFWGNRIQKDFIWKPNFKKLDVDVSLIVSRDNSNWHGEVGYVHDFALSKINNIHESRIYACGSSQMINSAKVKFLEAGLNERHFYSDPFVQSF